MYVLIGQGTLNNQNKHEVTAPTIYHQMAAGTDPFSYPGVIPPGVRVITMDETSWDERRRIPFSVDGQRGVRVIDVLQRRVTIDDADTTDFSEGRWKECRLRIRVSDEPVSQ